jgi:cobalt-zinc-cadmium resistance protein CzcA
MSLGAIDFGLIVDGSVVMIENIVRVFTIEREDHATPHLEKVRAAAHEVARPVVFAVGIIMIVYLPILALRGIEGKMFGPMAMTVVFALAGSLVCALTLMPVLASVFLQKVSEKEPLLFRWAQRIYLPTMRRTMAHRKVTAGVAIGLFCASLTIVPFLGPSLSLASTKARWRCRSGACPASRSSSPTKSVRLRSVSFATTSPR